MRIFLILMFFSSLVAAHGGRTNSEGCHNDNVNGGYHCHNSNTPTTPTITYSWNIGDWGDCAGNCETGEGEKTRVVSCRNSTGAVVDDFRCSGAKPLTVSSCSVNMCEIEPEPEPEVIDYPKPLQDSYVLRDRLERRDTEFSNGTAILDCVHTSSGFFNVELSFINNAFQISSLTPIDECDSFAGQFSFLTRLLAIYSVNNYTALLELDNESNFRLIHTRDTRSEGLVDDGSYDRDEWGDWEDEDGDCQNTRHEMLAMFDFHNGQSCRFTSGLWLDPYTGQQFTDASDIDIDHIVPLAYAHAHGGANWSSELKEQFYNDQENLLPVSSSVNRSKGSKSPAEWMPDNGAYHCTYVDAFMYVVDKYQLDLSDSEREAINSQCGE